AAVLGGRRARGLHGAREAAALAAAAAERSAAAAALGLRLQLYARCRRARGEGHLPRDRDALLELELDPRRLTRPHLDGDRRAAAQAVRGRGDLLHADREPPEL